MKKATKILITAAAVAAVAGVSAVSFAAWSGGSVTDKTITDTTGSIVILSGDITATTDLGTKKLVPYDQDDQYDATKMAKEMTITLGYSGEAGAVLKMAASGDVGGKLQYQDGSDWKAFTTAVTVSAGTIKVRLDSDDEENDMGAGFTITFSAEQPTVESGS